jgi:hypothetical protein
MRRVICAWVYVKVLTKLRSDCLPPEAEPASTAEYNKAVEHFENCKPEHGKQSEYINALFFTKNISMQHAILSRRLRGIKSDRAESHRWTKEEEQSF